MATKEEEKELLMQADPVLRKQYEAQLLREADPQLREGTYDPNVNLNSLGLIPPTTPPGQAPAVAIPGADPHNYTNVILNDRAIVEPPAALPPRAPLSWGEMFSKMYQNGGESLKKLVHSAYETWMHPKEAYTALTNGLPPIDKMEAAVNAAPATLGGIVLDQLSPEVRALVVKDHPELQPVEEAGKTFSEGAHNAGQAVANYLNESYVSRPGEPTGTALSYSLAERPWQTTSDLSIPLSLGGAGLAKMGLNAAWRASLAEGLMARGVPGAVAQTVVNAPRLGVAAMNPLNALIPVGKGTSAVTRKVVNALTPQRRVLLEMANGKGPQIVKKLDEAIDHPIIEGSVPTAAEAIEPNPLRGAANPAVPSNALLGPGSPAPLQLPAGGNTPLLPGAAPVRQLPGGTPQLPGGPAVAGVLDDAPSVDSLLLDGHSLDAITGPVPPTAPGALAVVEEAAAPPVRPTNVLNRNTPPGEAPGAPQPMNNALNAARPVEPEAPPRQAPPQPQQEARAPEPEAPQPRQEEPPVQAQPEAPPEVATPEPEAPAPESTFDFMGRQREVQAFIEQHPHMEALFKKSLTKAERDIAKAEEGLRASSKYGDKFIDIAKMNKLGDQEAKFKSWVEDEPNAAEVTRHYNTLRKSLLTAESARRRLAEMPGELQGWQDVLDKLARGEEGHLDINAIANGINKAIADYHAKNAAAGIVTLEPHPGIGVRGVPRPGSPGVVATKFSAAGSQAQLNNPDAFTELYNRNNAARMKVINETGKTGPAGNVDRPTAEAQHEALAKTEYGRAASKLSTADATFHNITTRPLSDTVMERARKYMGEGREPFQIGTYVPAHTDPTGKFVPAVYPKYSGKALQAIKQAFDDLAFDPNVILKGGASAADVRQIQKTRAEFLRWVGLRANNPELITAMKNYSLRENQIARMKFAEHLESILQKPISDEYTLRQRADAYANAIHPKNEAQTLQAATGRNMHQKFTELLTPKEIENLQAVKDDLTREALAKDHAHAGRDHKTAINNAASDGIGVSHVPGKGGLVNHLKEMVTAGADKRVEKRLSEAFETPQGARKVMANALAQQKAFNKVGKYTRNTATAVNTLTNRVPTTYNVIEQQRDAKKKKDGNK
jgi:hypothetical protein